MSPATSPSEKRTHKFFANAGVPFDVFCAWFLELDTKLLPRIAKEHNIRLPESQLLLLAEGMQSTSSDHAESKEGFEVTAPVK
jgi:hypothetical protein